MPSPSSSSSATTVDPAGLRNIDALLGGSKWGGAVGTGTILTYSFPWASGNDAIFSGPNEVDDYSPLDEPNATSHYALNATQQASVQAALQSWANVADINFQKVADTAGNVGDIRFGWTSARTDEQVWGWSYYPNSYWSCGGDVWLNSLSSGATDTDWSTGSYNYLCLIHEIGHGLGLKHPFDGSTLLPASLDNALYTVMSYTDAPHNIYPSAGYVNGVYDWISYYITPETPMVLDIAAIQYLYGANMNYHADNDVYSFDPIAPFFKTIWDAGGTDTISVSNFTLSCEIDLTPGNYSSLRIPPPHDTGGATVTYDGTNNLGIAYGAIIENATGGSGNDTLTGNSAANILNGGAGVDTLIGGMGNDTYYVDNGGDIVTETNTLATEIDTVLSRVTWTLGANLERLTLTGTAAINGTGNGLANTLAGNSAANILNGGAGGDTLNGGAGNDTLNGEEGSDILNGGAGADIMFGGLGNDTYYVDNGGDIVTETNTSATEIDTVLSRVSRILGANLENLTLTGTAAINGTGNELANTLAGNSAVNILNGGAGDDTLNGGAGNDTLNGGAGSDILKGGEGVDTMVGGLGNDTYYVDNVGDIIKETRTQSPEIDTVLSNVSRTLEANLENLTLVGSLAINGIGNGLDNTLLGNNAANFFNGAAGADILKGGAGNDTLSGGLGNDSLTGGTGKDVFVFNSSLTAAVNLDIIEDFTVEDDTVRLNKTIFSNLSLGILKTEYFSASSTGVAAASDDYILYNTLTGALLYDRDGNGSEAAVQFASLANAPAVNVTDFVVVA